jgi:GNAT superfamily N-acetyltransferase
MTIDEIPALAARRPADAFAASVSFRIAAAADVPALVPMINEAYMREAWLLPAPRTTNEMLAGEIADATTRVIVAEAQGALAGCVRVRLRDEGAWFGLLATALPFQGRRLAALLVAEAEALARRDGCASMRLECAEELGLPPYYASLGYAVESREEHAYFKHKGPITRIVMHKAL